MTAHFSVIRGTSRIAVRLANIDEADERHRIEAYVRSHHDATPFHRLAWSVGVAKGTRQEALWLLAHYDDGELCGLLPGHLIHSPLFGRALVSNGFAVGGGILADTNEIAEVLAQEFWKQAEIRACETAELRGGCFPSDPRWTIRSDTYAGFAGPLVANEANADEQQMLAIPRKQRAEIRKGLKYGLIIRIGTDMIDRAQHYAVYAESVRNLGTPVFPKSLFDGVLNAFGGQADILTVLDGAHPVASVLSLYHEGTVYPYWGGGVRNARHLRANDVMYYALMNHARSMGCRRFDFGRSKIGTGPYHFKKNWGFQPEPLSYAVRTADGVDPRDINPMNPRYRLQVALWKKLPLFIANRLGPLIARGLG